MNHEVDMQLKQPLLLFTLESAADTGNTRWKRKMWISCCRVMGIQGLALHWITVLQQVATRQCWTQKARKLHLHLLYTLLVFFQILQSTNFMKKLPNWSIQVQLCQESFKQTNLWKSLIPFFPVWHWLDSVLTCMIMFELRDQGKYVKKKYALKNKSNKTLL
jgi:hypothetical protein